MQIDGIKDVRFISKTEAAKIFKEEFGEDINSVLNFNPLPASFKIFLEQEYKNADSAGVISRRLKEIGGINEVIYIKTLLELLDRRARLFVMISLGIGIALTIGSIFLVSNTIRLAIYSKRKIIDTMKLVGATRSFIRLPFLIEGLMQGLLGGLFACGIIFIVIFYAAMLLGHELGEFVLVEPYFYGIIAGTGILLGLLGSLISVRRFISETIV
jgi:cell division transport system permease protein